METIFSSIETDKGHETTKRCISEKIWGFDVYGEQYNGVRKQNNFSSIYVTISWRIVDYLYFGEKMISQNLMKTEDDEFVTAPRTGADMKFLWENNHHRS